MKIETAQYAQLSQEIEINAPVDVVWAALTSNIGEWWPADFYAGGEEGARNFSLEAEPGGRMLETWDRGGGVLWGTVITVDPNVRLQVLGAVFPNWGGPNQWYGTWDLAATDTGTMLRFNESGVGRVSGDGMKEKDEGWTFLWNTLKAYVEGK